MKKKADEVTTVEAAKTLGVSVRTVQRWAEQIIEDQRSVKPRGAQAELTRARRGGGGYYVLSRSEVASLVLD